MATDSDEIKTRLLQSDEAYRDLAAQHQDLDQRLRNLSGKPFLTTHDQVEASTLKKKKLQLKDRMERILRQHRNVLSSSGVTPQATGTSARS
jgi:uncharacterized protein YdcH (DUF465 family)